MAYKIVNLNGVTSATNGAQVNTARHMATTIFVNVSVNTGAVTVNIEATDDDVNWYNLDSKTYTATTGLDVFSYAGHYPNMRTTTTTQTDATVTTTITGREIK